ncbi:MAG: DEAD/DEAH box helicase, partial [Gemmatimonadota bacterium]|nr:DEAD/DEAH box helicase [Gemmatimonadota bacterium]
MASFHDFGLQDFLLRPLEDGDVEHPTAVQEAVIPVLRRGGNLFARAGSGSGKTLAYTLGVFDRVRGSDDEDDGEAGTIRVLVLRPTTQAAERTALAMVPFAHAAGLGVVVPGGAWAMESAAADVIVASPADALAAVRGSGLKLDALEALVVDGASDILALGGRDAVESLLDHAPRDAQRVVLSAVTTSEVEDLVDRRVKRALRFPSEPAVTGGPAPAMEGSLGYTIVAEGEKTEMLIRLLRAPREGETPPVVFCRTDERAADLAEALSVRGFVVGEADDAEADVAIVAVGTTREELAEESGDTAGRSISFDIPADEGALRQRHGGDPAALVFATPRELPHLQEIARRARLRAGAVVLPPPPGAGNRELDTFRQILSTAVAEQDLGAQMLVLEPLFEAHGAAEVAA